MRLFALATLALLAPMRAQAEHPAMGRGSPPVVAGIGADLPALVRGRVLLGELGCTNCHAAEANIVDARRGPDLATVRSRVRPDYLQRFLHAPATAAPGTCMPDLLDAPGTDTRRRTADELAHYLRSFRAPPPAHIPVVAGAAERGEALWHELGCRPCHHDLTALRSRCNGKYTTASLVAFLLDPLSARTAGRMPDFGLEPTAAAELAVFLAGHTEPLDEEPAPDPAKVRAGRRLFAALRCANCHDLPDDERPQTSPAQPLATLAPDRGCLSGKRGTWPFYNLDDGQRQDLRTAIANAAAALSGEHAVLQAMAQRNCLACHVRGDIDRVTEDLERFAPGDPTIGLEGRLPPRLTGVGAKLQPGWLRNAIAYGQRERPYLKTRMPGFGAAFADRMAKTLATLDVLPDIAIAPLPTNRKKADEVLRLGRELVGDRGMNCIVCHRFAGEPAGMMHAIDLVHTTGERLRPEWFAHYLRAPFRFKPGTLMPQFFPDGRSTRPEIADGDVDRQIAAMWHYLAGGRNVRRPSGLRRPPIELLVADEAVLLRRAVEGTGKRGISVGYPGGINIAFDAETLALNQVWWGRFLDARPVWTGQGSGQARILARARHRMPLGPAFAMLSDPNAPWPTTSRREHGDRWLGYRLDQQRRPTFRYTCGDVEINDTPHERRSNGEAWLHRTLRLTGSGSLVMRLHRHAAIELVDANTARIGGGLLLHCANHSLLLVRGDGAERELRLPLALAGSTTTVELDYRLPEKTR